MLRRANPKKQLSRESVAAKQQKAVRFLRDVVGDEFLAHTDQTGDELSDEIEDLSIEEYAQRKGIVMLNPQDRDLVDHAIKQYLPLTATREDRKAAIERAREALAELGAAAGEANRLEAVCAAVSDVRAEILECQRQEEEKQQRQAELERARSKRRSLLESAKTHIQAYLGDLYRRDEIDFEEYRNPDPELIEYVEENLREELSGAETYPEADKRAEELVDDFLFEPEDDEPEDDDEEDDEEEG